MMQKVKIRKVYFDTYFCEICIPKKEMDYSIRTMVKTMVKILLAALVLLGI